MPLRVNSSSSGGSGTGIDEAPINSKKYARKNGAWVEIIDAEDMKEELDKKAGLDYISFGETEPDPTETKLWAPLKI